MDTLRAPATISYNTQGLVTAVVQDATSKDVLMVGYMNADALSRTIETGDAWFWSRSRQALWHKGETSGNYLRVAELRADCDGDALLVLAHPAGPTCHTGARSCFDAAHGDVDSGYQEPVEQEETREGASPAVMASLFEVIEGRRLRRPEGAYTTYLFDQGIDKICKKIGEEAAEVIIAAKNGSASEMTAEMADLFYHALVLLAASETPPAAVWAELGRRQGLPPRTR